MRLENSFLLAPTIGEETEKRLWSGGITAWDDLSGAAFMSDDRLDRVAAFIDKARKNLEVGNSLFFAHHLPRDATWRMYEDFADGTCFFDIETTGLDQDRDVVTTVSFHRAGDTTTLVRGRDLTADRLQRHLDDAALLVSFNGKRFDVPFLRAAFDLDVETPHLDLMYPLRRLGFTGGLKRIEDEIGIDRELDDIDGKEAIHLWKRYEKHGDRAALDKLVHYNRLDVVNLRPLLEEVHDRLRRDVFEPHLP